MLPFQGRGQAVVVVRRQYRSSSSPEAVALAQHWRWRLWVYWTWPEIIFLLGRQLGQNAFTHVITRASMRNVGLDARRTNFFFFCRGLLKLWLKFCRDFPPSPS